MSYIPNIYKFRFEEMRELSFNNLLVYSCLRQLSGGYEKNIVSKSLAEELNLRPQAVSKALSELENMNMIKIRKEGKDKYILVEDKIENGEKYNFFDTYDLREFVPLFGSGTSHLTYLEFKVFTTIRSYARKFKIAIFSKKKLSEITGIDMKSLNKPIRSLYEKGIIMFEEYTYKNSKKYIWLLSPGWNYIPNILKEESES